MGKTIEEWLKEGESLHGSALQAYQELQGQINALQTQLETKRQEINKLADVLGKERVGNDRPGTEGAAEVIDADTAPATRTNLITRALHGGPVVRR